MYTCPVESFSDETYTPGKCRPEERRSTAGMTSHKTCFAGSAVEPTKQRVEGRASQAEGHVCKGTEVHVILPGSQI